MTQTVSSLVERALSISDLKNTDFLTHDDLIMFVNDQFKALYQSIIEHNLDIFTVTAHLVGTNGVYPLPWDCFQLKEVKNPISGTQLVRKTSSFGKYSNGYSIQNNSIIIDGINPGPVVIVYWRNPFFLSLPNKTLDINIDSKSILSTSLNNILYKDGDYLSLWTPKGSITTEIRYDPNEEYALVKDESVFITKEDENGPYTALVNIDNSTVWESETKPDMLIKADSGLVYLGYKNEDGIDVYKLDKLIWKEEDADNYIVVNNEIYPAPVGAMPIGLFDNRPAYVADETLCLINPNMSIIREPLELPIMKPDAQIKYGIISNGKIYSNIPDTLLDFPNNILYEMLAYRLAICFLAKQNASSEGVQSMYNEMKHQFFSSIDMGAGYQRLNNAR